MNLLKSSLFTLGMLLIMHTVHSQEKNDNIVEKGIIKLSVAEAQKFALENNKSILNANLDIESAKKKVWETTAIGLPQASAKLSYSYMPELSPTIEQFSGLGNLANWMYNADQSLHLLDPANPAFGHIPETDPPTETNPGDMKWNLTGTVTVSQLIFSGSYLIGLQSAKVYKSLSVLNQVKSKQDVLESVENSYFNILIAQENKAILDSTYQNLMKTFSDMQAMGKQGFIEETDIDQMQITVSTVKSSLDLITRMNDITEKLLKFQLGIDFEVPVVLTDSLKQVVDGLTIDQLILADFVLDNNVTYQMLDAQVKASSLLLKLRKSEFLPDLAAFYMYQKEINDAAFTFTPPHVIGVSMNIPIFGSGQKFAKVSQAKIELLKAQNTKDQVANSLQLDFYNSRSTLLTARDKYQTESVNLRLSKKIYDRALIKYTNGMISSTDLTQIQNQYLTAQSNYYSALQNLIGSKNKLEKLLSKSN